MKLDKKDKQLLTLLYLNSRASFVQLGKKLKLSSSAVERRLRQLKAEGVIVMFLANLNMTKLGLKSYRIYLKFDFMDKKTENEVIELFEEYPRTLWGVICEGEYDVLWRIVAGDELEVERALTILTQKFGPKIIDKTIVTTTFQTYLAWNKALETERHPELPLEKISELTPVDRVDVQLLSALYENARSTTVEMSKNVGLTPDAVQHRIKRLTEKGFIMGYTAWFDAKKLGFNYYKLLIGFRGSTKELENEFLRYCAERDDVVFINKTIGSWDIEVDIVVRNNTELHEFSRDIKTKFGQIIGKHTFISAIEERMLNPLRGGVGSRNLEKKNQ